MKMMKISTKIATALLALGIISQASADPTVFLTGSSAFRSIVFSALNGSGPNNSANQVFDSNTVSVVSYGGGITVANKGSYMLFHGNIGGAGVYVNCRWSGSEA